MQDTDIDTSFVRYTAGEIISLCCFEGDHQKCPQGPDGRDGVPVDPPLFDGYYCECNCGHEA